MTNTSCDPPPPRLGLHAAQLCKRCGASQPAEVTRREMHEAGGPADGRQPLQPSEEGGSLEGVGGGCAQYWGGGMSEHVSFLLCWGVW